MADDLDYKQSSGVSRVIGANADGEATNYQNVRGDGSAATFIRNLKLAPEEYDDVVLEYRPADQELDKVKFYLETVLVATIQFEYDASLNLTRAYRV